jgi:phosphoenolpyruvate phosphomutase
MRAKAYLNAGADGIMIHSKDKNSEKILKFATEYKKLCKELNMKRPLVSVPTSYNSIYESELIENGFNIVIYANHMLRASYRAMEDVGKLILTNERSFETTPYIASVQEIFEKVGYLDIKEKDKLLSKIPSVIIPAAGKNAEFGIPKSLIEINGKTILEHQRDLFTKLGLNNFYVIVGYESDKFNIPKVNYIPNLDYESSGILNSLMKSKEQMKNGFIYLNSDLLIDERLTKELIERTEDIVIVVDDSYLYHKHELDKKLDAVITREGRTVHYQKLRKMNVEVVLIGKNIPREKMSHEFIGIAKFSKRAAENLIEIYEDLSLNHEGSFYESSSFKEASDTDMLQELINRGFKISIHETNGGWLEIHNENDIAFAKEILKNG